MDLQRDCVTHREREIGFHSHRRVSRSLSNACGGIGVTPDAAGRCGP